MKSIPLPILKADPESSTANVQPWSQWEALFEAMEDGVCVQSEEGRIVLANPAFAKMIGLPVEQIIGRPCGEIFGCAVEYSEQAQPCARLVSKVTQTTTTEEINRPQLSQRLRARVSPVRDASGHATAFVMVVRDVTDVALREREQARIEQIARLGEMVAGLAHEIKNPLAGIQGAVDILIQRRHEEDPERKVLEEVRHEVARIDGAMQALLKRARPRNFKFQPASLTETVQRAVGLGQAIAASATHGRVRVEFLSPAEEIVISMDAGQIEDAVLNLILNAIDAIDGPGAVTVEVHDANAHNSHTPYATVLVKDTGRGIPPENLQRIFNPFFTTNPQGTGLGLPAVRRILRAHGGRVEVTSTTGSGATFQLLLPYSSKQ